MQVHLNVAACDREFLNRLTHHTNDVRRIESNLASEQLSYQHRREFDELFLHRFVEIVEGFAQCAQQLVVAFASRTNLVGAGGQPLGMALGISFVVSGLLQFFQFARCQVSLAI